MPLTESTLISVHRAKRHKDYCGEESMTVLIFLVIHFNLNLKQSILGRAVIWVRGFVNNFMRVTLACLGSREVAEQQRNSQNTFYKTAYPSNSPSLYLSPQTWSDMIPDSKCPGDILSVINGPIKVVG